MAFKLNFLRLAVLTILVGTVFSGCGEIKPDTRLVIWSWAAPASALESNLAGFSQQFPGVELKIEQMERETLYNRLLQAYLAGGVGLPDLAVIEDARLESFNEKFPNAFANLTEKASQYRADFLATKWAQAEYKNKIRALPWSASPVALYYRMDLLPQGIAEIETWDDFIKLAKLETGKAGQVGLDISEDIFIRALVNQQNSAYFAADSRINLLSPAVNNAFGVLQKLQQAGLLQASQNQTELVTAIKNSKLAAYLATTEFANLLQTAIPEQSGKWRIILMPAIASGGKRAAQVGGLSLVISSKSANQELAWQFLRYALAKPVSQNRMFQQTGLLAAFLPALKDSEYTQPLAYFGNQASWEIFTGQVAQLTAFNFTENQAKAEKVIIEAQQAVLEGAVSQAAVKKAAAKLKQETGKEFFSEP